jgi:hypothetical protein
MVPRGNGTGTVLGAGDAYFEGAGVEDGLL